MIRREPPGSGAKHDARLVWLQTSHGHVRADGHGVAATGGEDDAHVRIPAAGPDDDLGVNPLAALEVDRPGIEFVDLLAVEVDRDMIAILIPAIEVVEDVEADAQ